MRYLLNLDLRACCSGIDVEDYVIDSFFLRLFVDVVRAVKVFI